MNSRTFISKSKINVKSLKFLRKKSSLAWNEVGSFSKVPSLPNLPLLGSVLNYLPKIGSKYIY